MSCTLEMIFLYGEMLGAFWTIKAVLKVPLMASGQILLMVKKVYSVILFCKDATGKNVHYSIEITFDSLDSDMTAAMIPIGQVGFKFVKQFSGGGYFNGIVKRICGGIRKMRQCDFNDGATHRYSLKQLERYSKIQVPFNDDTILGSDGEIVDSDNKSEESECEEENHDDDTDTDSENESSDDGKPSMNGKYFQKLVSIPSGMSTSQRLNELSAKAISKKHV